MTSHPLWTRRKAALSVCLLLLGGCKRRKRAGVAVTDEEGGALASVIYMADPKTAPQLLKGFHAIESNAWRWTMGHFAVALRPPRNSAVNGARLRLKFSIAEALIARAKQVTLSASVAGAPLAPETYTQAGEFEYVRDVDPKLLAGEAVNVEFALDNFIPSGAIEDRELGLIVASVGFEAK
jgi:hypothetical protein